MDTYPGMTWDEFIAIIEAYGFEILNRTDDARGFAIPFLTPFLPVFSGSNEGREFLIAGHQDEKILLCATSALREKGKFFNWGYCYGYIDRSTIDTITCINLLCPDDSLSLGSEEYKCKPFVIPFIYNIGEGLCKKLDSFKIFKFVNWQNANWFLSLDQNKRKEFFENAPAWVKEMTQS